MMHSQHEIQTSCCRLIKKRIKMSKLHCLFCSKKSISSLKSVETLKQRKLSKLIKIFGGVQIAKPKNEFSICKDCFHEASVVCKFYEKFRDQTVKKNLFRFSKRKVKSKSQNVLSQPELQTFILILNQIPKELFSKDCSEDRLKSIFCEYGIISHVYSCKFDYDNFARITFRIEQTSPNKFEAIQNKIKNVYHNQVAATLIAENESPIDVLPDDCLQRIFLYVNEFQDKSDIENVCQRWRRLATISWLNLKLLTDIDYENYVSIVKFEEILMHSKKSLKEIHIDVSKNAERQFKAVEMNCDNLKKLGIKFYTGSSKKFEKYVKPLFTAKQKLQKLLLNEVNSNCNFDFLYNLPENMVEIHLFARHMNSIRANSRMDFSKFRNLRVLQLYSFEFSNENSLSGLENLVDLEYFALIDSTVHNGTFLKMRSFTKLKHLEIPSQTVDDNTLSIIIRNNQNLEYLDISDNPNILNNTLQTIGELPKLDRLIMKNLQDLDGSPLSKLHKLTYLNLRGCSSITDWELMALIDRAPSLGSIDATGCNVTLRLLVSANETIKKRESMIRDLFILVQDQDLVTFWSEMSCRSGKIYVFRDNNNIDSPDFDWSDWIISD